mmetsp:Transcript_13756/g.20843  ORF Transcript_13756/g.20843 Transcript_13756/m.20843 type:complete len:416 (+) Transcript_13756:200-1447(+)
MTKGEDVKTSTPIYKKETLINGFRDVYDEEALRRELENKVIDKYKKKSMEEHAARQFNLGDAIPVFMEGVEAIVKDSFTECFTPRSVENWNHNIILFPSWLLGVFVRYCILVPLRAIIFILGTCMFIGLMVPAVLINNESLCRLALRFWLLVWMLTIAAVVKYHGHPPQRRKNQIYVSNHTSLIDYIILANYQLYASVGQKHGGVIGLLQDKVMKPLNPIFFERFETHDRTAVPKKMMEHIADLDRSPLLIFPEGVCVNNEYCVMFKKGVFELPNVEIIPIAVKFNKLFSDPYWSSRDESFPTHILRLMKSWCTVADVYFLDPQRIKKNESPIEFSNRIKKMIADRAGLQNIHWDGYLKYFTPNERLLQARQKIIAERLKRVIYLRASAATQSDEDSQEEEGEVRERKPSKVESS